MKYTLYDKPYKSPAEIVEMLSRKGLTIEDEKIAIEFLSNINFYRFKIYLHPFYDTSSKTYIKSSKFDSGIEIYRFDEELRKILFSIISKIEVKLRSRLDQVITSHTKNPFWYLDDNLFEENKINTIEGIRIKIASEFQRSRDNFSNHFKEKYYNNSNCNYKQLPPFWLASELTTLGNIASTYQAIKKSEFGQAPNNKLDCLAKEFGASNLKELNNWITCIRDLRNRCAHHSRVWNSNYRNPEGIKRISKAISHPNRVYSLILIIQHICNTLNISTNLKHEINYLLYYLPAVSPLIDSAGFPDNWNSDPFWDYTAKSRLEKLS